MELKSAKTSINKLIDENQIKNHERTLQKSIELDQQEDEELGDESGNSVPESLTDKEKFKETVKEIQESSKNNRNKDKLFFKFKSFKTSRKNPESFKNSTNSKKK